jgi:hypothetical protein
MEKYVCIQKSLLNRFHDAVLNVKDIQNNTKSYPIHRIVLATTSKFFEVLFQREKPEIIGTELHYKLIVPFSLTSMEYCLKIFYGDNGSHNYSLDDYIEMLLAVSYFHFPEFFLENLLCAVICTIETYHDDMISKQSICNLYQILNEYDLFTQEKKKFILERIYPIYPEYFSDLDERCVEHGPKFISENFVTEDKIVITEYAYMATRKFLKNSSCPVFRDMIFETNIDIYHYGASTMNDTFIGVTSRPIEEPKELSIDMNLMIRENRKNGKEILHKAKGKMILFNGLSEPFELPIHDFESKKRDEKFDETELNFPPEGSWSSKRFSYGCFVENKNINPMTKFKIVLEFY